MKLLMDSWGWTLWKGGTRISHESSEVNSNRSKNSEDMVNVVDTTHETNLSAVAW